jgi:hypothetical protein
LLDMAAPADDLVSFSVKPDNQAVDFCGRLPHTYESASPPDLITAKYGDFHRKHPPNSIATSLGKIDSRRFRSSRSPFGHSPTQSIGFCSLSCSASRVGSSASHPRASSLCRLRCSSSCRHLPLQDMPPWTRSSAHRRRAAVFSSFPLFNVVSLFHHLIKVPFLWSLRRPAESSGPAASRVEMKGPGGGGGGEGRW